MGFGDAVDDPDELGLEPEDLDGEAEEGNEEPEL